VKKLKVGRHVVCADCSGRGGASVQECRECQGRGVVLKVFQIAPGMLQQTQSPCSICKGAGEIIPTKDRCKTCQGAKKKKEESILEVHVDKGMHDGQKITFTGQGDQEVGMPAGDIVIILDEVEHGTFVRKGHNLIMNFELQLVEALCGFSRQIRTLDDRLLHFTVLPGEVMKHADLRVIHGEGMPMHKNPDEKGDLIVQFSVNFPNELSANARKKLSALLPDASLQIVDDDAEVHELGELSMRQSRSMHEDGMPEGGVRCQQQ